MIFLRDFFYLFLSFFIFSSSNEGFIPEPENLVDPPFICTEECRIKIEDKYKTSRKEGPDFYLVFSSLNNEAGFIGYNIWYGSEEEIYKAYDEKNSKFILISESESESEAEADFFFDIKAQKNIKERFWPSIRENSSSEIKATRVKIKNVEEGKSIFVNAYVSLYEQSPLSNGVKIDFK